MAIGSPERLTSLELGGSVTIRVNQKTAFLRSVAETMRGLPGVKEIFDFQEGFTDFFLQPLSEF